MKLHQVTIENLNSLYGSHTIDFENDLGNAPLFLIQGQTGAGKSTILDAICLCLFGSTPRLARGNGRPDEDTRHIMSYGTGTCQTTLVFSIRDRDGQRHKWKAKWECRRARGSASGNLQDPNRSLWRILEDGTEEHLVTDSRKKYFEPLFEDVLEGMDIDDFQRSVLLAQGQFAAFLKASERDKATILERLTDTTQYKEIGERAAAKRKAIKQELDALENRLEGLPLLTDEEEKELHTNLEALNTQIEALRKELERSRRARDLLAKREEITGQLDLAKARSEQQQQQLEARAEDVAKLKEDRRCRPHEAPLQQHLRITQDISELQTQLAELAKTIATKTTHVAEQTTQQDTLAKALAKTQTTLEELRPTLEKARALGTRTKRASQERDKAKTRVDELGTKLKDLSTKQQKITSKRDQLDQEVNTLQEEFNASAHLVELEKQLPAIKAKKDTLHDANVQLGKREQDKHTAAKRLESAQALLEQKTQVLDQATTKASPLTEAYNQAKANLTDEVGESDSSQSHRKKLDQEFNKQRDISLAIDQALGLHDQLAKVSLQMVKSREQEAESQAKLDRFDTDIQHTQALITQNNTLLQTLEKTHHELDQILVLADKRRALKEHEACPLCGSKDHPYMSKHLDQYEQDWVTRRQEIEDQATQKRTEHTEQSAKLRELELERSVLQTRIDSMVEQRTSFREATAETLGRYNGARHRAGLAALEEGFPKEIPSQESLRGELKTTQGATKALLAKLESSIEKLSSLQEAEFEALTALKNAEQEVKLLEGELQHATQAKSSAKQSLERESAQLKLQQERCETLQQDLMESAASLKPSSAGDQELDLDKLLQQAATQIEVRKSKETRLGQKRDELDTLARELATIHQSIESITSQSEDAQSELTTRSKEFETLHQEQQSILEGKDPDVVEADHKAQIDQAAKAHKELTTKLQATQTELTTQTTQQAERTLKLEKLQGREKELLKKLDAALKELSLESLKDLKSKLLPEAERQALEGPIGALERDLEHATFAIERLQEQLKGHNAKLEDDSLGYLQEHTLEEWRGECALHEKTLETNLGERGALDEKLRIQKEAVKQAATYREELDKTRATFGVWETLFKLIGRKDGDSFKLFAQSLNLQELIDRANHRLARLNPRYALAAAVGEDGEPVLDFAVCDHHQADTHRPLTTLSGGETFLVSLALALALADFRRLDMPIETLLLDEGFGTLDQETLDTAMSTLRQLQQENLQQVGIISHVETLKERVESRIMVEKLGNGRSTIRVEHGAQGR